MITIQKLRVHEEHDAVMGIRRSGWSNGPEEADTYNLDSLHVRTWRLWFPPHECGSDSNGSLYFRGTERQAHDYATASRLCKGMDTRAVA